MPRVGKIILAIALLLLVGCTVPDPRPRKVVSGSLTEVLAVLNKPTANGFVCFKQPPQYGRWDEPVCVRPENVSSVTPQPDGVGWYWKCEEPCVYLYLNP